VPLLTIGDSVLALPGYPAEIETNMIAWQIMTEFSSRSCAPDGPSAPPVPVAYFRHGPRHSGASEFRSPGSRAKGFTRTTLGCFLGA
jgi:hypothetical protein